MYDRTHTVNLTLAKHLACLPPTPGEHLEKLEIIPPQLKEDTSLRSCVQYNFRTRKVKKSTLTLFALKNKNYSNNLKRHLEMRRSESFWIAENSSTFQKWITWIILGGNFSSTDLKLFTTFQQETTRPLLDELRSLFWRSPHELCCGDSGNLHYFPSTAQYFNSLHMPLSSLFPPSSLGLRTPLFSQVSVSSGCHSKIPQLQQKSIFSVLEKPKTEMPAWSISAESSLLRVQPPHFQCGLRWGRVGGELPSASSSRGTNPS